MSTIREEVLAEMPSESVNFYCSPDEKLSNNVHDVHHVHSSENEADAKRADIERHVSIAESVIVQAKDNAGLYAGSEFIHAMKFIREQSDEDWVRLRVKIKNKVSLFYTQSRWPQTPRNCIPTLTAYPLLARFSA